jgi:hypothetical protein
MWASSGPKQIALFPSKKYWRAPSKSTYLSEGLDTLRTDIIRRSITSIALPHLGCSNGGLLWSDVKPLIIEKLSEIDDLRVELWKFDQNFIDQDSKKTENFVREVLSNSELTNFVQLAAVKGVGKKTLEKIYRVALAKNYPVIQSSLDFEGFVR